MQHIFNIAIDMDDDRIKQTVAEKAEKEILARLTREVGRAIFEPTRYYYNRDDKGYDERFLNAWTQRQFNDFLTKHKDEIIAGAAKELADRLARTKAAKAILDNLQ